MATCGEEPEYKKPPFNDPCPAAVKRHGDTGHTRTARRFERTTDDIKLHEANTGG